MKMKYYFVILFLILAIFLIGWSEEISPAEILSADNGSNNTQEMVLGINQTFTIWQYKHAMEGGTMEGGGEEKVTQFRLAFKKPLFEGEKYGESYETPPHGKVYIKIPFNFENIGPRAGARAPEIEGELKTNKGYIYPEKYSYFAKIHAWAGPGEKGNGNLIFLIPSNEVPVELTGSIFGSFPYYPGKSTRFKLTLSEIHEDRVIEAEPKSITYSKEMLDLVSIFKRIQRLGSLLSEGTPVRERDWVTRQLDRLTGAEWVIDNAIWLFELAQEQWQEACDFFAETDLENAQRRVIYAEATLLNAFTTLSAAYGVIDEGLARAERVVWYYRKGAHESEKLVALLGFGPKGYEVASKLCLLDDFVVEGLTQGWEGASKTLAFRLVLDKLIDAGILSRIAPFRIKLYTTTCVPPCKTGSL